MEYKIVTVDEFTVAGLTTKSTMENNQNQVDVPRVRKDIMARKMELPQIKNERNLYDVCWPHDAKNLMKFTYIAGYEVAPDSDIPDGMTKLTIPGGKYALFTHKGGEDDIMKTWEKIPKTLLSSGYNYNLKSTAFTILDERFIMNDDSERYIHIPIF